MEEKWITTPGNRKKWHALKEEHALYVTALCGITVLRKNTVFLRGVAPKQEDRCASCNLIRWNEKFVPNATLAEVFEKETDRSLDPFTMEGGQVSYDCETKDAPAESEPWRGEDAG